MEAAAALFTGLFGLAFGWFWLVLVLLGTGVSVGGTVLWIIVLVEVLQKETDENNTKLLWALVVVLTGWIGALIYLFVRRPERQKTLGR
jgi:hypothetical protein